MTKPCRELCPANAGNGRPSDVLFVLIERLNSGFSDGQRQFNLSIVRLVAGIGRPSDGFFA